MAIQFQNRRGTVSENNSFTGAAGEVVVDTTNNRLRVHDGVTVGGIVIGDYVNVKDFGATGDGVTDDTAAIQSAVAYINTSAETNIVLDFDKGTYLYDLLQDGMQITRNNVIVRGKAQIKIKSGTYDVINQHTVYTLISTSNGVSHVTIEELTLNCNNQASDFVYPGTGNTFTEIRFVRFNGDIGSVGINNRALNLRYTNGNGQVVVGNFQKAGIISGVVSEIGNIGIGWNESESCIVENCYCKDARDASFCAWYNSTNIQIINNNVHTNTNGNGIDCSGSSNVLISGNTIRNCQNSGIWVGEDPNGNIVSNNVIISNNILSENCQYNPNKGEIRIAQIIYADSGLTYDTDLAATNVLITGNMINATVNNDVYVKDAEDVSIIGNFFKGVNSVHILWNTSNHIEIKNNSMPQGGYYEFQNTTTNGSAQIEDYDTSNGYIPLKVANNSLKLFSSNMNFFQKINLSENLGNITFTTNGYIEITISISHIDQSGYSRKTMIFKRKSGTVTNVYDSYDHYLSDAITGWEPEITYSISGDVVYFTTAVENAKDGWFSIYIKGNNAYFSKSNTI